MIANVTPSKNVFKVFDGDPMEENDEQERERGARGRGVDNFDLRLVVISLRSCH